MPLQINRQKSQFPDQQVEAQDKTTRRRQRFLGYNPQMLLCVSEFQQIA